MTEAKYKQHRLDNIMVFLSDHVASMRDVAMNNPDPAARERAMRNYEEMIAPKRKKPKEAIPGWMRWLVWERDNFTCWACGTRQFLSCDHVLPESLGGMTHPDNLQTLCRSCNSKKGTKAIRYVEAKEAECLI